MNNKLIAEELTLFRGDRCLFSELSFALNSGELLLLEGPNGSGKTSLMRVIAGLLEPEDGRILWNGQSTLRHRQAFHADVVWMAHRVGLKGDLTLVENLRFESSLRSQNDRDLDEILDKLGIRRLKALPTRALSAGQQRRVAVARMLLSDARLWFMDEPFTNLDRDGRKLINTLVETHLSGGGMCVMAAHQDVAVAATINRVMLQ